MPYPSWGCKVEPRHDGIVQFLFRLAVATDLDHQDFVPAVVLDLRHGHFPAPRTIPFLGRHDADEVGLSLETFIVPHRFRNETVDASFHTRIIREP